MYRIALSSGLLCAVALAFCLSGCNSPPAASSSSGQPTDAHKDHGDHDHGDHAGDGQEGQSDMDKMNAELAKLSPEDAATAKKQHMCPVSNEMLGTMGAPQKVDVNGQQVWICCDGCRDQLLENPDELDDNEKTGGKRLKVAQSGQNSG